MIWVIGDIQGCYQALKTLLKKINFDPQKDRLWIAGDLVNRGEGSLETLSYLYSIKDSIDIVLGNHDIALIGAYYGIKKSNYTIDPILKASNSKELIDWLRQGKFLHVDKELGYCMAHAGISPSYNLETAIDASKKLEKSMQSENSKEWLTEMFSKDMSQYNPNASDIDSQKYALASFIRMRFCDDSRAFDFKQKGSPNSLPSNKQHLKPWFALSSREKIDLKILFGHWSTLGFYNNDEVCSLDTGCVWGGSLTAMRIDDKSEDIIQVTCS